MKKIVSFLLVISVLCGCSVGVLAVNASLDNFTAVETYTDGQFTDIPAGAWYSGYVQIAYELGLMRGDSESTFNPTGTVTLAEAVTMASRLHSIYNTGAENFIQGDPWYQCYVDYALENNIIENKYEDYTAVATRGEFAEILAYALPADAIADINAIVPNSIPDVSSTDEYSGEIYKLYRAGILNGNGDDNSYNPNGTITRSEASALLTRLALPSTRLSFSLGLENVEFYENDPEVPDFGAFVDTYVAGSGATPTSHSYRYLVSTFDLNALSDWTDLISGLGFEYVDGFARDGGFASVYQKGDITLTVGMSEDIYYLVEVSYTDVIEDPNFETVDDLVNYLNAYYNEIVTPLGTYRVETEILVNNSSTFLYDWRIESSMSLDATLYYALKYGINYSEEDKAETVRILREYQRAVYEVAANAFPDKKIAGGFYSSYYRYEHVNVGYESIAAFSWMNYSPRQYVASLDTDYYDSEVTEFQWVDTYDDYTFEEYFN